MISSKLKALSSAILILMIIISCTDGAPCRMCKQTGGGGLGYSSSKHSSVIHSSGSLSIPQTYTADLDKGTIGASGADIWFEADTATKRWISPWGDAKIANMGPLDNCNWATTFSKNRINIKDLRVGSIICVLTNQGRLSRFRVDAPVGKSPGLLKISYTTWEK